MPLWSGYKRGMHSDIAAVPDGVDAARIRLSEAVKRVLARAGNLLHTVIRALPPRIVKWLTEKLGGPARVVKSLIRAIAGEDRGFGFWWLVATAAIGLAIGLLVAALLSPVIGIVAALVVGIWMLARRSRSSESRDTAEADPAS